MLRAIYNKITSRHRTGATDVLEGETGVIPIEYRRRVNARRYILRMNAVENGGCVTIPRGGSLAEAKSFAKRNARWLEDRIRRREAEQKALDRGKAWFRGEELPVAEVAARIFQNRAVPGGMEGRETGEEIKHALRQLAQMELPGRVGELAAQHKLTVRRVTVRDQRSRWGSCSARGVVSLNWRLVQTPEFVRDYIIVHELMHLREMNHSSRFWKLVAEAFPRMEEAENWLKAHSRLLRSREF